MNDPTELIVVTDAPPPSLILASSGFLRTLAEVEEQARELKITDAASAQLAASLQIRLTEAGAQLEKQRKVLKAPFIEINRRIDEAARAPSERVDVAKNLLKHALTRFDAEQRRLAEQRERDRLAEIARLEKIRADEIAAENARKAELERIAKEAADKAAAAPTAAPMDFDDEPVSFDEDAPAPVPVPEKTAAQVALENIQHAPAAPVARPSGITFKTTLVAVVVDLMKLPEPFVERSAKMKAINATYCSGWREGNPIPDCPGVRFEVKRDAVSTGRNTF